MRDVFIVDAIRTPVGRGKEDGALHHIHPVHLLATCLEKLVEKAGVAKNEVEDIVAGCVTATGEQGTCIGRLSGLKAGFPQEVPALQLNRFCGSGQQAIHFAAQAIAAGDMEMTIGCGIESMSRVLMGSDGALTPEFRADFPVQLLHQGVSAEMVAAKWNISRGELDEFAALSHCRAATAQRSGWTVQELFPMTVGSNGSTRVMDADEGIRPNPDVAKMGMLKAVFKPEGGVITAANSSQVSDGAGAVLLASEKKCKELGLKPRARVVARAVVGSDPELMLTGPIPATQAALKKAGLKADDIDIFEVNEAFASVPLAWQKEIGVPIEKLNIQGGAIAHGHPLGATGAILMTKMVNILERTGGRYGLQTMCIGFGMATATIIERV
jgi:acetyl-CoA acetyltransferase family protein